ncbi:MAG: 1-deoxy-D-xylulose-5-phosphate synthase [Gammaproteobacteria bacterium]|nr:1-deoxy-D-xylulose-5-phosphate synthase [Gammaproteobacteria bacterium]
MKTQTDLTVQFPLLAAIDSPDDLRRLNIDHLPQLADECRHYMLQSLDQCGGHFGASMGAVEITIALHYVYDTPNDRLVWDVGHQAYIHKMLTGRLERLNTIKQPGGLAPFCKRSESEFDSFGVGHSSTSISAALGMAAAFKADNNDRRAVAIIGDGGLTGGMAFEALNHAGDLDPNMLVVLNDNDMSISENVGALNKYLARILSGKLYMHIREGSKKVLSKMPPLSRLAKRTETHLKGMISPGTIFEELGFNYIGPIDGHDIITLVKTLQTIRSLKGAKFLHIITVKGKGYQPAEQQQIKYHAVKPGFYSGNTKPAPSKVPPPTYSQIFGQWLCDMAPQHNELVAITPAMSEGSGMTQFTKQFPKQYFDVGIAEQHSVTFAAGLATEGKKPIVAIYSTFLQRGYDQLIHDVALQNLDVTFAIDRAGLVGSDGPTHAGSFDLSYMRCIPNMVIMAPANENECRQMLFTGYQYNGPAAIRYPRGSGAGVNIETNMQAYPIGKSVLQKHGNKVAILAFGSMLQPALEAAEVINATVVNMRFIKPIDRDMIIRMAQDHSLLVTIEENAIMGGAGSAVCECLNENNITTSVLQLGLPDCYIEHGNPTQMLTECGLDKDGVIKSIQERLAREIDSIETRTSLSSTV